MSRDHEPGFGFTNACKNDSDRCIFGTMGAWSTRMSRVPGERAGLKLRCIVVSFFLLFFLFFLDEDKSKQKTANPFFSAGS